MIYRILPLMLVGLIEYKFMGELSGGREEKELALLFEKLLAELRDGVQGNYDSLQSLFRQAPATDRTVLVRTVQDGTPTRPLKTDRKPGEHGEMVLPRQSVEEIITLRLLRSGTLPLINSTYHLSDCPIIRGARTLRPDQMPVRVPGLRKAIRVSTRYAFTGRDRGHPWLLSESPFLSR